MRHSITNVHSPSTLLGRRFKLPLIILVVAAIGCSPESALSGNESIAATAEAPATPTPPQEPTTPEPAAQTYSQKLAAALEKAAAAKDAVVDQLTDAGASGSQAASDSVAWAFIKSTSGMR